MAQDAEDGPDFLDVEQHGFFPILQWLPNYEWKNWFASDIIGGIVTGVMHVPQGIAYAQLAGVDAVVVAGFTTGASVHVFAAQLKFIFGLSGLPARSGAGNLIMFLNPLLKKNFKLNVPIPFELFLMVLGTSLSFLFHGHSKYGLEIVDHIPAGIPTPIMPDLTLLPELLPDAIAIAGVVMAVHISLAKIIAKKKCYRVDPGQELFALGFSSTLSSFFPVYPVSCSLGRTLCVLSSIIIVALKGIFRKIADLRRLWPLSRIDFSIWLVSFVSTVCWDVSQGLVISIGFALLTTVFRTQWPRWHFLANLSGTNDFRDAERYELIHTFPGICIFRFDSPLLFTNVDNFKETIHKAFQRWKRYQGAQLGLHVVGSTLRLRQTASTPSLQIFTKFGSNGVVVPANLSPQSNLQRKRDDDDEHKQNERQPEDEDTEANTEAFPQDFNNQKTLEKIGSFDSSQHLHFIVDCSGFTFVDCMGVNALKEIFTEMRQQRVRVYFAAAKAPVRDLFEKCGFYEYVPKRNFYPTIRDAVAIARMRRNASSQNLLEESVIHRVYDEIETMQITQPEQ
uniref:STAS domain-containing protein n=1 Tax=Meloidogyne javanica TaxID=6303 RepID=A0A915LIQ7_MELJA